MKTVINPTKSECSLLLQRPKMEQENLSSIIQSIFNEVGLRKDDALRSYTQQFDGVLVHDFKVSNHEIVEAEAMLSEELKSAILKAATNIERFHQSQIRNEPEIETTTGVTCWRKSVGIERVGLYIPGGTAPLFSTVLMLGIPAKLAKCTSRILCTPPSKSGTVHPAILYAAKVAGITEIFKVGGAQAIAAMSLGTESITKVDKIFGPGNQYVTAAKMESQRNGIAIDMPAGPSEVLVAADDSIAAAFVAADLLAQAEHGVDSQVIFLTDSTEFVQQVLAEIDQQLAQLPRAEIAKKALESSTALVIPSEKWSDVINEYAPEHLIIMGKHENQLLETVVNAGSVFIGKYTAESFGDYASGTNHTLPTAGFARSYSGVSLDSFTKKITYQRVSEQGLKNLGPTVITMANAEELVAHAQAIALRLATISNQIVLEKKSEVKHWIRADFQNIQPYSSARDEFEGTGEVFLDANENGMTTFHNRYPDPLQIQLKKEIATIKNCTVDSLFLGNGSDEVLDLIFRLVGMPHQDSVAFLNPSYGMYSVLAKTNGLNTKKINLDKDFQIEIDDLLEQARECKILVICNPNNPTGKLIPRVDMMRIVNEFKGVVVVDEAYIDFCQDHSIVDLIDQYSNLIIVQTLSKAFGMAGLRIGMARASEDWISALNSIKPLYNISSLVQESAVNTLQATNWNELLQTITNERKDLMQFLSNHPKVLRVIPSEANFILFEISAATEVYNTLVKSGIIVRNRSNQFGCDNMLRVSVGSPEENNQFKQKMSAL